MSSENQEKYDEAFVQSLGVAKDELPGLGYKGVPQWDSVGQMKLLSTIEEAFSVQLSPLDIMDFESYESGKKILSERYGITF